jgi:hypothetical protein
MPFGSTSRAIVDAAGFLPLIFAHHGTGHTAHATGKAALRREVVSSLEVASSPCVHNQRRFFFGMEESDRER